MPNLALSHLTLNVVGVIPILPTIHSLFLLLPVVLFSALAGLWSLRHVRNWSLVGAVCWRFRWHIGVLTIASTGIIVGTNYVGSRERSTTDYVKAGDDWPMARGDLCRRASLSDLAPNSGGVLWRYQRGAEVFYSSPAIVGDRVYVVGSRGDSGRIYCLHALTGDVVWSSAPSGYRATFSSPVIAEDRLVVGEGLHHVKTGRVVCIDLREGNEGDVLWTFATQSHVECTPTIANGHVYVGAGDDGLYCLKLHPQGRDAEVVWHVGATELPDVETSLAATDNVVYVGLGIGGNAIVSLAATTGEILHRTAMPFPVFSPPAIIDDRLYVGMGVGDYVTPNEAPAGQLCCLDRETLSIEWNCRLPGTVLGAPTIIDNGILCGCADGHVYLIDSGGSIAKQLDTGAPISGSVAVAGDRGFAMNQAGVLTCFDTQTLDRVWHDQVGGRGFHVSSPVVAHGHVYVGTDERGFFCIGNDHTSTTRNVWFGETGGGGALGCIDDSTLGRRGEGRDEVPLVGDVTAMAAMENHILVAHGTDDSATLSCFAIEDDGRLDRLWDQPQRVRVTTLAMGSGHAIVQAGAEATMFDLADGSQRWRRTGQFQGADEEHVWIALDNHELQSLTYNGDVIWTQPNVNVAQSITSSSTRIAVVCDDPSALQLRDKLSGVLLWETTLEATATSAPFFFRDSIVVTTPQSIQRRAIVDGAVTWQANTNSALGATSAWIMGGRLCYRDEDSVVTIVDEDTRNTPTKFRGSAETTRSLASQRSFVGVKGTQLRRWSIDEPDAPTTWFELAPTSTPQSPMVLTGNHVIVVTSVPSLLSIQCGAAE